MTTDETPKLPDAQDNSQNSSRKIRFTSSNSNGAGHQKKDRFSKVPNNDRNAFSEVDPTSPSSQGTARLWPKPDKSPTVYTNGTKAKDDSLAPKPSSEDTA